MGPRADAFKVIGAVFIGDGVAAVLEQHAHAGGATCLVLRIAAAAFQDPADNGEAIAQQGLAHPHQRIGVVGPDAPAGPGNRVGKQVRACRPAPDLDHEGGGDRCVRLDIAHRYRQLAAVGPDLRIGGGDPWSRGACSGSGPAGGHDPPRDRRRGDPQRAASIAQPLRQFVHDRRAQCRCFVGVAQHQRVLEEIAALDLFARRCHFKAQHHRLFEPGIPRRCDFKRIQRKVRVDIARRQLRGSFQRQYAVEAGRRRRHRHALHGAGEAAGIGCGFPQAHGLGIAGRGGDVDVHEFADVGIGVAIGIVDRKDHRLAGVVPGRGAAIGAARVQRKAVATHRLGQWHELATGDTALAPIQGQGRTVGGGGIVAEERERGGRRDREHAGDDGVAAQRRGGSGSRVLVGDARGVLDIRRHGRRHETQRKQHRPRRQQLGHGASCPVNPGAG